MASEDSDEKYVIDDIITPIESSFLEDFNKNKENVEWLDKVREKYGTKIDNLWYPLIIERIIFALVARNRSNEIYAMIEKYLCFYDKYELDKIMHRELPNERLLNESWPMFLFGTDKMGHPVFYDDLGTLNMGKTINAFKEQIDDEKDEQKMFDLCKLFRFKFYAKMAHFKQVQSQKYKTRIFKHILVMDMANFSYFQIAANLSLYSKIGKEVLTTEQMLYPMSLYRLYLINCPMMFSFAWQILSKVIDENTLSKIKLLGSEYLDEMKKEIDIEQIPMKYGGKATGKIVLGGDFCK